MGVRIALIAGGEDASPEIVPSVGSDRKDTTMRRDQNGQEITIRVLGADDAEEVRRVAERDSSDVPALPLLGAEVSGRLVAAVQLDALGCAVADPFVPTSTAVAMLKLRADQLRGEEAGGRASHACSSGAIVRPAEASCSQ